MKLDTNIKDCTVTRQRQATATERAKEDIITKVRYTPKANVDNARGTTNRSTYYEIRKEYFSLPQGVHIVRGCLSRAWLSLFRVSLSASRGFKFQAQRRQHRQQSLAISRSSDLNLAFDNVDGAEPSMKDEAKPRATIDYAPRAANYSFLQYRDPGASCCVL